MRGVALKKWRVNSMLEKLVIGVDFGSASVRATVIDCATGSELSCGVSEYARWKAGRYQHPEEHIFRQHPLDYLESLEACVLEALSRISDADRRKIVGIGVDTTGSTPAPVDASGKPLALTERYAEQENAMFFLWKDHSAAAEAEEINRLFTDNGEVNYCRYQGDYSAEWFWAKILHCVRTDEAVRRDAYTWVEHCDWMVGELCGNTRPETMYHSACAAGHKALWNSHWNGLPSEKVLNQLDPYLAKVRQRYGSAPRPATAAAGTLTREWAERFGLPQTVVVSGSSFDAHAGAVGTGIREKTLICTLGTSAVDMLVVDMAQGEDLTIGNFGGMAENSILPGYLGIETGQAAFGDIFAWFKNLLLWPLLQEADGEAPALRRKIEDRLFKSLERAAESLPPEAFPIALDWFNGRRYPDTDDFQKAAVACLSMGTTAPALYKGLVFGALSGLRRIVDGLEAGGLEILRVIAAGGISRKSDFLMQMMADLLEKEVSIVNSDQNCALGAAMYAAVAAGVYPNVGDATTAMAAKVVKTYIPDPGRREVYRNSYRKYRRLAEAMS